MQSAAEIRERSLAQIQCEAWDVRTVGLKTMMEHARQMNKLPFADTVVFLDVTKYCSLP